MPRKIRELMAELETNGFENKGGKGSHRNFVHPKVTRPITILGNPGDDERAVFDELCQIVEETIELYQKEGRALPPSTSGYDWANRITTSTTTL